MKKIIALLILITSISFGADSCKDLYDSFKAVLEPQMTQLCVAENNESISLYDFYIHSDEEGYTKMEIAFTPIGAHLFIEGDENPFKCGKNKDNKYQKVEDILKIIFIGKTCEPGFHESIGVTFSAN